MTNIGLRAPTTPYLFGAAQRRATTIDDRCPRSGMDRNSGSILPRLGINFPNRGDHIPTHMSSTLHRVSQFFFPFIFSAFILL
jgi:hypothetical protein